MERKRISMVKERKERSQRERDERGHMGKEMRREGKELRVKVQNVSEGNKVI